MAGQGTQRIDNLLRSALEPGGRRVLVGSGWGGMGRQDLPGHWRMLDSAPHDKLFPRVAVVVHHGGAGTTATALRAGVPQVVVPLILDQYYHAHRLHLAGLAPPPVAMERISAQQLSEAVGAALGQPAGPRLQAAQRLHAGDASGQIALRIEGLKRPPNPVVS
jgi:UDP:flavonoid glycosyltransferase YjiC (YdhE family)